MGVSVYLFSQLEGVAEPVRTDPPRTWESALEGFDRDWVTGVFGISLVMVDSAGLTPLADRLYVRFPFLAVHYL